MRVHRLEITAFGPFAGTEVIDFDPLNAAGVFLLTGETGAGKTSILDAICFGLFGQVPGLRDKAKAYRSHHAREGLGPRIVLEVTLRGRRLRITRHPPWLRPSRRARSGWVEEKARASVEEHLDGGWVARSSRADEVGHLLTGLLGLNRDQFCQVVLLAQGEFQTFLRAGGRDRQRVLESLFGTQRFQAVERWLGEHRRVQSRRYQDQADRLDRLVARLEEVCSPVHADERFALPEALADWSELLTAARQLADSGQDEVERADAHLEDALTSGKHAQHAYDQARACADLRRRHCDSLRRHDELTAAADLVAARELQVTRARAAEALLPLVRLTADAAAAESRAADAVADARATQAHLPHSPDGSAADLDTLTARVPRLSELLDVEQECDTLARLIEGAAERRFALVTQRELLGAEVSGQPAVVAALRRQIGEQAAVVARGVGGEARLAHARAVLAASREAVALEAARFDLRDRQLAAHEAALEITERWLAAKERLLAGMAAELAQHLRPGESCPVCGSTTHPSPAAPSDTHVNGPQEAELYACVTQARAAADDIDRRIEDSWTANTDALVRSGGLAVAQAQQLVDEVAVDISAAASAAEQQSRFDADLARLLQRCEETSAALESATTEADRHDELVQDLQTRLTVGLGRLTDELGADVRVAAALELARRQLELGRRLEAASRELEQARRVLGQAHSRLSAALEESCFSSAEDVLGAALTQPETATLEALNRAHLGEIEVCRRDLRDPALVAAAAAAAPDLAGLEAAAAATGESAHEASGLATAVRRRQVRLEELVTQLAVGVSELAPMRRAKDLADDVAGVCSGSSADNVTRTALSNYVLAARLAQVVEAANARLDAICSGRYQLEHTMTRGAGDTRGGLGLAVHDSHTDRTRDPATLSGGETFYVSLSLALGLADVVTSEVGGTELATLFVDEGFGGLDDETRDEVLDELDALRSGGRTIGLVSHLSELRARVPTQLHVVAGPHGSTCRPRTDTASAGAG